MPSLARALTVRLFATRRLALMSTLRLTSLGLLLCTLPDVLHTAIYSFSLYCAYLYGLTILGLIVYILPGLVIALVGIALGGGLVLLFVRGYMNLAVRFYNWLYQTYTLAQDDITLNTLFAAPEEYVP